MSSLSKTRRVAPTSNDDPSRADELVVPIDFGDHNEDIATITISLDRLASALVTEVQRFVGAPPGPAADVVEERRRMDEVARLRALSREVVRGWQSAAGTQLNQWMRASIIHELFARAQSVDTTLELVEQELESGHLAVLGVPQVQAVWDEARRTGTKSQKATIKRLGRALGRLGATGPRVALENRSDVIIAREVDRSSVEAVATARRMKPQVVRSSAARGRGYLREAGRHASLRPPRSQR
jgi:hypothetical protein